MTAQTLDGKAFAARLRARIATQVADLAGQGIVPGLAVVLVGEDPASQVYVRSKGRMTREVGMTSFEHRLPASTDQDTLMALIAKLNADPAVNGILVQLPLPKGMDEAAVINAILPEKDVDGFHILNVGRLATGQKAMVPCTPLGCLMLLRDHLAALCRQADILAAAVGRPHFVQGDWIKPGATVIDVGINRTDDGLVGDVDFAAAVQVAGAITPVPGGVGPMTIACLLANTLTATARSHGLPDPEGLTP